MIVVGFTQFVNLNQIVPARIERKRNTHTLHLAPASSKIASAFSDQGFQISLTPGKYD